MSRIEKLNQKLLDGRSLTFAEFERLLRAYGFHQVRQRGSHRIWRNTVVGASLTILPKGKDAHEYQTEELADMIERHGLTLDESHD